MSKERAKNKSPLISIIIPSYNKGKYIKKTLQSIVDQDYKSLEVIIMDGGSTDESIKIIKKFAKKHKAIKWVSKKDKGQLDAINKGMKKAKGDILTYINADDLYMLGALMKVASAFNDNPDLLWVVGRGKVINNKGEEISKAVTAYKNLLLKINSYSLLLSVNYLMQPSVFINRKVYTKYGPYVGVEGIVIEYPLWLSLGKIKMPYVLDEVLSAFRLTHDTLSAQKFNNILAKDYEFAERFTSNFFILLLHKLNNYGRIFMLRLSRI